MTYKEKINVVRDGNGYECLDLGSLDSLTVDEWSFWMQDRLDGGKDRIISPGMRDQDGLYYIFSGTVPNLKSTTRTTAFKGIEKCLDEAYRERKDGSKKKWTDEMLDGLLMIIAGEVEFKSEGLKSVRQDTYFTDRQELIRRFLDVVNPIKSHENGSDVSDVYSRTLQALIAVGAHYDFDFWKNKLGHVSPVICFAGALANSPYDAIKILSYIDWSNEDAQHMPANILPFLNENKENPEVMKALEEAKKTLPEEAVSIIEKIKNRSS